MTVEVVNSDLASIEAKLDLLLQRTNGCFNSRFMTVIRAAEYANLSEESVRRLLASGKLTALRPIRGRILIDRNQLESLVLTATATPRTGRGKSK
jgi:excisionase family DNA binding protein